MRIKPKQILLNCGIAITLIVCYSPGLLNLRPDDSSILRAGSSIVLGIGAAMIFFYGNWILMKEPEQKQITVEEVDSLEDASRILKQYCAGKYFGKMAKTASEQLERLQKTTQKALTVVSSRFSTGSISYNRYYGIVEAAGSTAIANVIQMANRMSLFDEKEYAALQHYQEDDIPDDVQEQQIALYQKSLSQIQKTIEINERLILKMNSLAMEMMSETEEPDALLEEIEELTKQAKYYK